MSDRVVIERDEMDRIVLMRMDLDRYEAQLIPDLQQETLALRHALRRLVEAVREAEHLLNLEATASHRGALRGAERLLVDLEHRREEQIGGGQRRRDTGRHWGPGRHHDGIAIGPRRSHGRDDGGDQPEDHDGPHGLPGPVQDS